jgi:hypothetical protein
MDYGAPSAIECSPDHPERVSAFVIRNGNADE